MKNTRKSIQLVIYILLQCTWGILQTLVGLLVFLINITSSHNLYHGAVRTQWSAKSGLSLGLFIFVATDCSGEISEKMSVHEYGHTLQSLLLGPLYLLVIGLPSFICFLFYPIFKKKKEISYYDFFTEKWAEAWGKKSVGYNLLEETMIIRRTTVDDLEGILIIYADARAFMTKQNNPDQWGEDYPSRELLETDIRLNRSYVCILDKQIVGTFCFEVGVDPTYLVIFEGEWLDDASYGVIHRIASARDTKGVASFCVDWCFNQTPNIRIDTHRNNSPMINFLEKKGYMRCGIIYIENGDERIAFHKVK